jgi:shikimate dehydrogenase
VTLPYTEQAINLVSSHDEMAQLTGAVNTLVRLESGRFHGKNTDVQGFISCVTSRGIALDTIRAPLVVGAGGAARAVLAGLILEGCPSARIVNRTRANAERLLEEITPHRRFTKITIVPWEEREAALADTDMLVNATQLGMRGQPELPLSLEALPQSAPVVDLIYAPLETPLLRAASARGNVAIGGLHMLIHQAVPGFEEWFGVTPVISPRLYNYLAAQIPA